MKDNSKKSLEHSRNKQTNYLKKWLRQVDSSEKNMNIFSILYFKIAQHNLNLCCMEHN